MRLEIVLALGLAITASHGATNLLPGLRVEKPSSGLSGRFVFLYSTNWDMSGGTAQVYKFDPKTMALRIITAGPAGEFYSAKDGKTFCILHGANVGLAIYGTNAFIYSERLRLSRTYTFQEHASAVTFGQDHVFFYCNYYRVFDYDIAFGSLQAALLPGLRAPEASGSNVTVAVAYDDHSGGFETQDGRWIFFQGRDAPYRGTRLVSSPLDEFHTSSDDPKGKNVRALKHFSTPLSGSYNLTQLSPCLRYALIQRSFPIRGGWGYTYYAVNVLTGETTELFEDKVCSIRGFRISEIHWVGDN